MRCRDLTEKIFTCVAEIMLPSKNIFCQMDKVNYTNAFNEFLLMMNKQEEEEMNMECLMEAFK